MILDDSITQQDSTQKSIRPKKKIQCSLLISYLLRDLSDAIFGLLIVSEIQFSQLLFNCVSSGFPNVTVYATWHVSHRAHAMHMSLISLVSSGVGVMRHDCHEDAYCRESAAFVECSFQMFDSYSTTLLHRCLELELRPRDCWFIIELTICYILHRYLILSSLSEVICIIYRGFCHRYNLCTYIP